MKIFRIRHRGFRPTLRQQFNRLMSAIFTAFWTPWRRTFEVDFTSITGEKRAAYLQHRSLAAAVREANSQRHASEIIRVRPAPLVQHIEFFDPLGEMPSPMSSTR